MKVKRWKGEKAKRDKMDDWMDGGMDGWMTENYEC